MNQKAIFFGLFCLFIIHPAIADQGIIVTGISTFPHSQNGHVRDKLVTVSMIANGNGQEIFGEWQQLGEYNLSHPFRFGIGHISESLKYPILNQGALFRYNAYYSDRQSFWKNASCMPAPAYCYPVDTKNDGNGLDRTFNVYKNASGQYGRFGESDLSFFGQVNLSMNGSSYLHEIGSGEIARSSIQIPEINATLMWSGSLITGQAVPNQDNYVAIYYGGYWQVVPLVVYETYTKSLITTDAMLKSESSRLQEGFDQPGHIWNPNYEYVDVCQDNLCSPILRQIQAHNIIVDRLTSKSVRVSYNSPTSEIELEPEIKSGNMVAVIDQKISNPQFILTVPAVNLGVSETSGKPEILNITAPSYNEGDGTGFVRIQFKNIGNAQGTFAARIAGAKEAKLTLNPEEIGEVTLFIDTSAGILNGTVEVYDVLSGEMTSGIYRIQVKEPKKFIPNESRIDHDVEFKSSLDGMQEELRTDCTNGVWQYKGGEYGCYQVEEIVDPATKIQPAIMSAIPEIKQIPEKKDEGFTKSDWIILIIAFFLGLGIIIIAIMMVISPRTVLKKGIGASILKVILVLLFVLLIGYLLIALYPVIKQAGNEIIMTEFMRNIKERI